MEISSIGTKLMISTTKAGTYKELYGLKSTPDMGGEAEKLDITNHGDIIKRYIKGVKELGDMVFGFWYNSQSDNPNVTAEQVAASYSTLRGYDNANTTVYFKLIYPDGTGFSWCGSCTVIRTAAEVNSALAFNLKIMPLSDIEDIVPAVSAANTTIQSKS